MKYAKTSDEKAYQDFLKEILLENCLGWHRENVVEQQSIPLGATQRLIPDLIVYKDGVIQFIVEVKHPFHTRRQEDIEQLASYMKQLEVNTGVYIGNTVEVYYKKIGDGSSPDLILSAEFKSEDTKGDEFINLFSSSYFSIENVESLYQKHIEEKELQEETCEIIEELCSPNAIDLVKKLITDYLEREEKSNAAIEKALNSISITIQNARQIQPFKHDTSIKPAVYPYSVQPNSKRLNSTPAPKIRVAGKVKDVAFNLISEIIRINSDKTFVELYRIFGKKNFIEAVKNIHNPERWIMDEMFTSIDGTKFVISNQWGINGACKPRFDYLLGIAKSYGIDITIPYFK